MKRPWSLGAAAFLCFFPHIAPANDGLAADATSDPRRDATVVAIERAAPSVVNIATKTHGEIVHRRVLDFWRGIIEVPLKLDDRPSAGSGVIIDEEGHVLTNVHVIVDETRGDVADEIWVQLWDGSPPIRARVLVGVPGTDVAVLKLDNEAGRKFQPIKMAANDDILLGETVIALGNPLGLGSSVTKGIISAKPRRTTAEKQYLEIPDWLQIDVTINPGNSGGALINLKGEMIGLNVAIPKTGQGIGFAIPVSRVSAAVSECFTPEALNQLWLGLRFKPTNEREFTVAVIHPGSPAEKSGLRPGDVITKINGVEPKNRYDAYAIMAADSKNVRLTYQRNGETNNVSIRYQTMAELIESKTGMLVREITSQFSDQLSVVPGVGLLIDKVVPDSAAAQAGLRPGMILGTIQLPVPGQPVIKTQNLLSAAAVFWNARPGDTFQVAAARWQPRNANYVTQNFLLELQ